MDQDEEIKCYFEKNAKLFRKTSWKQPKLYVLFDNTMEWWKWDVKFIFILLMFDWNEWKWKMESGGEMWVQTKNNFIIHFCHHYHIKHQSLLYQISIIVIGDNIFFLKKIN